MIDYTRAQEEVFTTNDMQAGLNDRRNREAILLNEE